MFIVPEASLPKTKPAAPSGGGTVPAGRTAGPRGGDFQRIVEALAREMEREATGRGLASGGAPRKGAAPGDTPSGEAAAGKAPSPVRGPRAFDDGKDDDVEAREPAGRLPTDAASPGDVSAVVVAAAATAPDVTNPSFDVDGSEDDLGATEIDGAAPGAGRKGPEGAFGRPSAGALPGSAPARVPPTPTRIGPWTGPSREVSPLLGGPGSRAAVVGPPGRPSPATFRTLSVDGTPSPLTKEGDRGLPSAGTGGRAVAAPSLRTRYTAAGGSRGAGPLSEAVASSAEAVGGEGTGDEAGRLPLPSDGGARSEAELPPVRSAGAEGAAFDEGSAEERPAAEAEGDGVGSRPTSAGAGREVSHPLSAASTGPDGPSSPIDGEIELTPVPGGADGVSRGEVAAHGAPADEGAARGADPNARWKGVSEPTESRAQTAPTLPDASTDEGRGGPRPAAAPAGGPPAPDLAGEPAPADGAREGSAGDGGDGVPSEAAAARRAAKADSVGLAGDASAPPPPSRRGPDGPDASFRDGGYREKVPASGAEASDGIPDGREDAASGRDEAVGSGARPRSAKGVLAGPSFGRSGQVVAAEGGVTAGDGVDDGDSGGPNFGGRPGGEGFQGGASGRGGAAAGTDDDAFPAPQGGGKPKTVPTTGTPGGPAGSWAADGLREAFSEPTEGGPRPAFLAPLAAQVQDMVEAVVREKGPGNVEQVAIKLHPEHLGRLVVRVGVDEEGVVHARFAADNAHVRALIEQDLGQLRHALEERGLVLGDAGVEAEADGAGPETEDRSLFLAGDPGTSGGGRGSSPAGNGPAVEERSPAGPLPGETEGEAELRREPDGAAATTIDIRV